MQRRKAALRTTPTGLAFAQHVDRFVAGQGAPSGPKRAEMRSGANFKKGQCADWDALGERALLACQMGQKLKFAPEPLEKGRQTLEGLAFPGRPLCSVLLYFLEANLVSVDHLRSGLRCPPKVR